MTQSEMMRQIAAAMERNPERWWKEFCYEGEFYLGLDECTPRPLLCVV